MSAELPEKTGKPETPPAPLRSAISHDWRLLNAEIRASTAYADALVSAEVLTAAERDSITAGLQQIKKDYESGKLDTAEPDMFLAIENRLNEIVGAAAGKLSAGRSRNEQVMTVLRLWLMDEIEGIGDSVASIQKALIQQAEGHVATLMPGYTHFQPSQVVSCAHWLLSYFWMLARDQERLTAVIGRTSVSPLGSGSLAGTAYRIDRHALAQDMSFSEITQNSMDAVGDSDFAAEFLFVAVLIGIHLSRLAEDLILYSNPALGFLTIDPRYTSGSALTPHKRNPEAVELSRGKAGRLLGDLMGFLSTLKGLPSTYNQDTQENQQALFDGVDSLTSMLTVMEGVIDSLTIHPDRMWDALSEEILASDLADYLVDRAVPYREAYAIVEKLIDKANKANRPISDLPLTDFQAESAVFDADVFAIFDYSRSAARRGAAGGTASAAIRAQIRQANNWLMESGLA
ncbi:MAG: argininosuccinate lyase [Anaerolineae bacterium]|nr:argininosuccinate lyase [Anaerolineae bacterium]